MIDFAAISPELHADIQKVIESGSPVYRPKPVLESKHFTCFVDSYVVTLTLTLTLTVR